MSSFCTCHIFSTSIRLLIFGSPFQLPFKPLMSLVSTALSWRSEILQTGFQSSISSLQIFVTSLKPVLNHLLWLSRRTNTTQTPFLFSRSLFWNPTPPSLPKQVTKRLLRSRLSFLLKLMQQTKMIETLLYQIPFWNQD